MCTEFDGQISFNKLSITYRLMINSSSAKSKHVLVEGYHVPHSW